MSLLYELKNIEHYYDGKKVLNIDNLTLYKNQIVGFFGPNGSGKSTLFSLLSFICKPTKGEVFLENNNKIDSLIKKDIVMLPQNPYLLKRSVFENIAYGLEIRAEKENLKEKVDEALSLVGLDSSFSERKWSQLSGGEAQRVSLASRLILKPKILILDEPTAGVDTNSAQLIKEAILLAKQKYNTTIFISSHDYNWLNHISDKKIALFQGNLVENGNINLLFAPWIKDENGNLVKVFIDGQRLIIPNSQSKKRDSVIMINSSDITVCKENCEDFKTENILLGVISSIHQDDRENIFQLEFSISGINFNCPITKEKLQNEMLFPGDKINVNINLENICWI